MEFGSRIVAGALTRCMARPEPGEHDSDPLEEVRRMCAQLL